MAIEEVQQPAAQRNSAPAASARRPGKKRVALGILAVACLALALAYTQKDRHTDRLAALSRDLLGDEATARIESWYFTAQDRIDRWKYGVFGGETNPFDDGQAGVTGLRLPVGDYAHAGQGISFHRPPPPPLELPQTRALRSDLAAGEGVWTTAGLPRSMPGDVLMAKTFIRPDSARPYATVGVLLLDKRRIRLQIRGGTQDPGGDLGVKGPGVIPMAERRDVLVAWNGGFRGPHGGYGMYADGRQYRPLRSGFASVVVTTDGAIRIGEWGRDLTWSADIVAVRQNAALLVDNCEVSRRTKEGNATWGYVKVNSAEFITWRSAIGVTRNGDLLVAAGNSLSADSLARALWAAGACYAMQLDINTPYVLTSLYFPQPDGSIKATKFMDSMADGPGRFFTTQPNDFMYVTLDETNYNQR